MDDEKLFNEGTYEHESGFVIAVSDTGTILISPNHPLSLRLVDIFDESKWKKVESERSF